MGYSSSNHHLSKSKMKRTTIHQILGGGHVADVILWRRKNVNKGILVVVLGAWLMFRRLGYSLLPFLSNVLLLLTSILFVWSKSARVLNRPEPQLPRIYLSEELMKEMSEKIRVRLNLFFSGSRDTALGKDTNLFFKAAVVMLLISLVGSLTDLITLGYISLIVILTIPVLYEKFEDQIDEIFVWWFELLDELNIKIHINVERFIAEIRKLS